MKEYAGGYDDWLSQKNAAVLAATAAIQAATNPERKAAPPVKTRSLNFKEQRELDELPRKIENWETEQARMHEQMASPAFFKQDPPVIAAAKQALEKLEASLSTAYRRWEELEALAGR